MKTLGFAPFCTVQTDNFIFGQDKFQLAPYQPALAVNRQQLIERNEIFMLFARYLNPRVEKLNPIVRMLRHALAQRCRS